MRRGEGRAEALREEHSVPRGVSGRGGAWRCGAGWGRGDRGEETGGHRVCRPTGARPARTPAESPCLVRTREKHHMPTTSLCQEVMSPRDKGHPRGQVSLCGTDSIWPSGHPFALSTVTQASWNPWPGPPLPSPRGLAAAPQAPRPVWPQREKEEDWRFLGLHGSPTPPAGAHVTHTCTP